MAIGWLKIAPELVLQIMKSVQSGPSFTLQVIENAVPEDATLIRVFTEFRGDLVMELDIPSMEESAWLASPVLQKAEVI